MVQEEGHFEWLLGVFLVGFERRARYESSRHVPAQIH